MGIRWKGFYRHAKSPEDYLHQRSREQMDNSCIVWSGGRDKDGYGQVQSSSMAKKLGVTRAHQMAYIAWVGPIPPGAIICHTCDNPPCINPEHLYAGTWQSNMDDCIRRGRYRSGATKKKDHAAVLNYHGKLSCIEAAKIVGCSYSLVCQIWRKAGLRGKNFHKGVKLGIDNTVPQG